jgi:phosphoribosylaminoimidazole (AIR) synthetase
MTTNYEVSGVSINNNDVFVESIKDICKKTYNDNVLTRSGWILFIV